MNENASQGAGTAIQQHQGAAPIVRVGDLALAEVVQRQLWKDPTALKGKANVLFPVTALDDLPPMMRPSLSVVHVNADVAAKEVYPVGGGQLGLSKAVIEKMCNARGISIVDTRKLTPRSDLDHIEWQATVEYYTPAGQKLRVTKSRSWDWGEVQAQCSAEQAKQQRKFADEITESKAILRACRTALNCKASYTKEELALPFLIATVVPDLDMSDPEVKTAYINKQMGLTSALYPSQQALPPSEPAPATEELTEAEFKVGEEQPAQPSEAAYDPLEEETAPAQVQPTEEEIAAELDGKIRGLVESLGKERFGKVLAKHNVTGLKGASIDLKTVVVETAEAVKEGRLTLG